MDDASAHADVSEAPSAEEKTGTASRLERVRVLARDEAARGVRATLLNLAVTLVIQVATVPVFLHAIGVAGYSQWLVLTAIPAYLSLADLGFAAASATRATQLLTAGDRGAARTAITSAWMTVSGVGAAVVVAAQIAIWILLPADSFSDLGGDPRLVLSFQLLWVFAWMQIGFIEGGLRAHGLYPQALILISCMRIVEFGVLSVTILATSNAAIAAGSALALRSLAVIAFYLWSRARTGWFTLWPGDARWAQARELIIPSFTYAGFSAGLAGLNQGMILLIGGLLPPAAVVTYATLKTLTGVIQQLVGTVTGGTLPELTIALARGNRLRALKIFRAMSLLSLSAALSSGLVLWLAGPSILSIWTQGRVEATYALVALMAFTMIADVPWQVGVSLLRAQNRHQVAGVAYLCACLATLATASILLPRVGLSGAPLALFVVDVVMIPIVLVQARPVLRGLSPKACADS